MQNVRILQNTSILDSRHIHTHTFHTVSLLFQSIQRSLKDLRHRSIFFTCACSLLVQSKLNKSNGCYQRRFHTITEREIEKKDRERKNREQKKREGNEMPG